MARTLKSVKAMKALKAMKTAKAAAPAARAPAMKPMKATKRATHGRLTVAKLAFLHRHKKNNDRRRYVSELDSDVIEITSVLKVGGGWARYRAASRATLRKRLGWARVSMFGVGAVARRVARDAAQIRKPRR